MTVDRPPLAAFEKQFAQASNHSDGRLSLRENPLWLQVNLRIDPIHRDRLTEALGAALPTGVNTVTSTPAGLIAGLGPDEWLVIAPDAAPGLDGTLRSAVGSVPVSVVDVSAGRTILAISGTAARDVLAHGCALDLDARHFPAGTSAQTRLALANIVLIAPPEQSDFVGSPEFFILVRSSFAAYLATWLLDAASEYLD